MSGQWLTKCNFVLRFYLFLTCYLWLFIHWAGVRQEYLFSLLLPFALWSHAPLYVFCCCRTSCEGILTWKLGKSMLGFLPLGMIQRVHRLLVIDLKSLNGKRKKQSYLLGRWTVLMEVNVEHIAVTCSPPFPVGLSSCLWLLTENLIIARGPQIWKANLCF